MIGLESFTVLQIVPRDVELHASIMEIAPRADLPELTTAEIDELEYLRVRYDVLIGIVDPTEAGIDPVDVAADRAGRPHQVNLGALDETDLCRFIQEHTTVHDGKIATFLYCICVEEAACGVIPLPVEKLEEMIHCQYIDAVQRSRPVVLVVDEMHWSPKDSDSSTPGIRGSSDHPGSAPCGSSAS